MRQKLMFERRAVSISSGWDRMEEVDTSEDLPHHLAVCWRVECWMRLKFEFASRSRAFAAPRSEGIAISPTPHPRLEAQRGFEYKMTVERSKALLTNQSSALRIAFPWRVLIRTKLGGRNGQKAYI